MCEANVPARFMRWPIGAADDKFLDIKNAVWMGQRLPKTRPGNLCTGVSTTIVDGVKIMHGCCNAEVKSGALFGDRVGFDTDNEGFKSCNVCGTQPLHNKDNFRVDIGLDGEGEKEVMNYPAATRKLFFEPILTGSALEAHNALVRKQAEYQNLLPVMKMFVKQVDEDHKANKDSIRAPANATYAITINFDVRRAWIACYPTSDDAKAERNAIRTHEIDLEGWRSAKVWVSTKTQETIFCIPRIDAFNPPRELPAGAQELVATGAPGEYYFFPRASH